MKCRCSSALFAASDMASTSGSTRWITSAIARARSRWLGFTSPPLKRLFIHRTLYAITV